MSSSSVENQPPERERELTLIDLAAFVLRNLAMIAVVTGGTLLLALLITLIQPKSYTARTLLVPPPSSSSTRAQLLSAMMPAGVPRGLMGESDQETDRIIVILQSRALADSVVQRMGAGEGTQEEAELRKILSERTKVQDKPDGSIEVLVTAESAELSARIANEIPELLNSISAHIGAQNALRKQEFLEHQVADVRENLLQAEQRMVEFQTGRGVPEVQEQARQTIEAAGELQQRIMAKEVEVAQLSRMVTPTNPELTAAASELAAMRGQLRRLTSGAGMDNDIFLSLSESPELKMDALRALRQYTESERMYAALAAALAETQLDAQNNLPVVAVLDSALEPRRPSGPGLIVRLVIAGVLGVLFGVVAAGVREWMRAARRNPDNAAFFASWDGYRARLRRRLPGRGPRNRELASRG